MTGSDEIVPGFSMEEFAHLSAKKWNAETCRSYCRSLMELKNFLDVHGPPGAKVLKMWCAYLHDLGYSERSVNLRISAANNYFRWCGRTDLVMHHRREPRPRPGPELTRSEYLLLLKTARALHRRRLYLLIKLFATADLPLQCLDRITVEVIRRGSTVFSLRGSRVSLECPAGLREELLDYAADHGIEAGPIFVTRTGQTVNRSNLCREMQELCRRVGIEEQKGNPRSLRNLYRETQLQLQCRMEQLIRREYDRLLRNEQALAGWEGEEERLSPVRPFE